MPATATAPAQAQALLGRSRGRGPVELVGVSTLVMVLALLVLTMTSPLDRAGRGAHAVTQLSASASAAHTHTNLATLTQAPTALLRGQTHADDTGSATSGAQAPGGQASRAADAPAPQVLTSAPAIPTDGAAAIPVVGQDVPSGHNGDHHHHVDLDPMSTGALSSGPAPAFVPAPAQLLSVLLVAAVTLSYPD